MEARVLFIISKGQNLSVWSGSALDSFGGGCGTLIVTRLLGWLFLDTKQSRHLIKCLTSMTTGQKTATDCVQKAPWNILISFFFHRIWSKCREQKIQKRPRWECAGKTFHSCLNWKPLRSRNCLWLLSSLLIHERTATKMIPNNSPWMTDTWKRVLGKHFLHPLSACSSC